MSAPDDDLMELVHTVMHLARSRQQQLLRAAGSGHDLTHLETKVLGFFSRHPNATLGDMAQHSGRDKPQLTRLIKGLRERGWLHSEADAHDRRVQRLSLTDAAHHLMAALEQQVRVVNDHALKGLNPPQRATLKSLLLQVQANLNQAD
jgi:DNA-binding MarR family transcriptional regulator